MDGLLQWGPFLFVFAVAVDCIALLMVVALVYLVGILRDIKGVSGAARGGTDIISGFVARLLGSSKQHEKKK